MPEVRKEAECWPGRGQGKEGLYTIFDDVIAGGKGEEEAEWKWRGGNCESSSLGHASQILFPHFPSARDVGRTSLSLSLSLATRKDRENRKILFRLGERWLFRTVRSA